MKPIKALTYFSLLIILLGCNNPQTNSNASIDNIDMRPKEEIYFLNKVSAESDYDIKSDAIKKDAHIEAFNKYAIDSLKKIQNWEMIITNINDNGFRGNSVARVLLSYNTPVYNIELVAPIKYDNSVDTIAIDNRVDFTFTIPKQPTDQEYKKQISILKSLNKGDTVIVSGALTHLNSTGKIDFSEFYNRYVPWNVDLLINDIHKK